MPVNKVIVTNLGVLKSKYGAGLSRVQAAITKLITADAGRGLTTILLGLDDTAAMGAISAPPVTIATDPGQNKAAIDGVYNNYAPDYLIILGAVDVVPHQDLVNPTYTAATAATADPDAIVFSDLPYACPGPYSTSVAAFTNPTRVVGRLPDVTGGSDPAYFEKVLDAPATYASGPASTYQSFFAVTAAIWTGSTNLSLGAVFGTATGMEIVPPATSAWPASSLNAPSHFFNCHGAPSTAQYYGQPASGAAVYPVALDAAYVAGKIQQGTVMAAEACYGAELYDPSVTGIHQSIANQYLEDAAYAFFGSTTVAYGPSSTNDWADLICQYFFQSLLMGASIGRSALQARQQYLLHKSILTATDLKTLAQFILLGDPSVTPVASTAPPPKTMVMTDDAFTQADSADTVAIQRSARRLDLIQNGLALAASVSTSEKRSKKSPPPAILNLLKEEAGKLNLQRPSFDSFVVKRARSSAKTPSLHSLTAPNALPSRRLKAVHRTVGRITDPSPYAIGIAGVEILEFEDGVTIHPFQSRSFLDGKDRHN
jgi:hypothetical protein